MNRISMTVGITALLSVAGLASASITVDLGTLREISPRPTLEYSGGFSATLSSSFDGSQRTIIGFNLGAIVQSLGGNLALVEVRVRDGGGNSYGTWSPGADLDLMRIVGANLDGNIDFSYSGGVAPHTTESAVVLAQRVAGADAAVGDQHYNSSSFVSLGQGGVLSMLLGGFLHSAGSSGDGGEGAGGGGPGQWSGGGGGGNPNPVYGGLIIQDGMMLELSEAGSPEYLGVELVFETVTVPTPGALALLGLAGFAARRRR